MKCFINKKLLPSPTRRPQFKLSSLLPFGRRKGKGATVAPSTTNGATSLGYPSPRPTSGLVAPPGYPKYGPRSISAGVPVQFSARSSASRSVYDFPTVINEPPELRFAHSDASYPFNTLLMNLQRDSRIHAGDLTNIRASFPILRDYLLQKVAEPEIKAIISNAYGGDAAVAAIFEDARSKGVLCDNFIFIVFHNALCRPSERGKYLLSDDNSIFVRKEPSPPRVPKQELSSSRYLLKSASSTRTARPPLLNGKVSCKDSSRLRSCIIPTSGNQLKCGYYAMASGIAQLKIETREFIYSVLGLTPAKIGELESILSSEGALKGSAGWYQRALGDILFEYSRANYNEEILASAISMHKEQVAQLGFDSREIAETTALAHLETVGEVNAGADRLHILAAQFGFDILLNDGDPPARGIFIHIYNPHGGHYSAINMSRVDYTPS